MLEQVKSPLGLFGRVRAQVWVFLGAMVITGTLMTLGVMYLGPAHEGPAFAPDSHSEAVVQTLG